MTKTTLRWGVSACAMAAALAAAHARAQTLPAPAIRPAIDAQNVDVITGTFNVSDPEVSIGPTGRGLTRVLGQTYADDFTGFVSTSGSSATVIIGSSAEAFTLVGGVWTPVEASGSSLTYNSTAYYWTYTLRDGSVARFSDIYTAGGQITPDGARLGSIIRPNGETDLFTWVTYTINTGPGDPPIKQVELQSVTNNYGAQIYYQYANNNGLLQLSKVIGINSTVDYCNPSATACSGFSQAWPTVTVSYPDGVDKTVADPLNRSTAYNANSVQRPSGATATYTTSNGKVASVSNGIGTWTYAYSTNGATQTTTVTDPNGHTKTYVSDTSLDVITSYTDALSRTTGYGYDGYGRLISVTHPHGDVVTYTYDENESSARGNVTTTTWTPAGGGTPIVNHASYDASCTYAAKCNKPNTTTDGNGNVTAYTYDTTTGVLLSVTKPADVYGVQPQTRYSYSWLSANIKNAAGQIAQGAPVYLLTGTSSCNVQPASQCIGTADETRTSITYDPNHNLAPVSVTTSAGDGSISSTRSFSYDAYGNLATSTNPLGGVTTYFYDADRELTGMVGPDPDGAGPRTPAAARITYTADGLVGESEVGSVASASPSDFANFSSILQTLDTYDSADRLVRVASNGGGASNTLTQYSYDNANNLKCTAVRMNVSTFGAEPDACTQGTVGFDGADRITYRNYDWTDALLNTLDGYGAPSTRYSYIASFNPDGTLASAKDGNGNLTSYSYDGFERLSAIAYPMPNQKGASNPSDTDTFIYDADSNVTQRRFRDGSTLSYSHDGDNNMTSDGIWGYGYDTQGRLTGASNPSFAISYAYDALGRKTSEASSNGGLTSTYDAAGDRTRLTWHDGFYVNYDYDLTGKMLDIRENGATSGIGVLASYGFDSLGRVNAVMYGGILATGTGVGSDSLYYDTAGRIGTWTHGFGGDAGKNLIVGLNYNPAGQVRTRTYSNSLYEWTAGYNFAQGYGVNGLNQVATAGSSSFSYNGRGSLQSDGSNTYGYEAHGQLASVSGSANATLAYDPIGRLVSTQGSTATRFLYDGSMITDEHSSSGALLRRYVPGPNGTPIVWYEGAPAGDRRWLYADPLGSVVAVMNSSGTSDGTNTYDAYGLAGPSNTGRFQFAGRPWIPEAGLYDNSARSYSPTLGRFLQTDPIGYGDGMNWYAYTHNDPVNGTDPTGLVGSTTYYGYVNTCFCGDINANSAEYFSGFQTVVVTGIHIQNRGGLQISSGSAPGAFGNGDGGGGGGGGQGQGSQNMQPRNTTCAAVAKLPKGYGVYFNGQVTAVPGAGFSDALTTSYVSNGQGGVTYTSTETAFAGNGVSIFAGGSAGLIIPNLNLASGSTAFSLGGFLPKGGFKAAVGLGLDFGHNMLGLSLGVGYAAGILGANNPNNSASRVLASGGC